MMMMSELHRRDAARAERMDQSLREMLAPMFRRKRLMGFSLIGFLMLAVLGTLYLSSIYKCEMEVLVNRERMDPKVTAEVVNQTPSAEPPVTEEEINSEVELLQSPDILQKVVLAMGLQDAERTSIMAMLLPKQSDEWYIARATNHLANRMKVAVVKKTNMIEVSYKNGDPQTAFGVMDKLAGLYMEKHLTVHRPTGSYEFFSKETDKYRELLAKSEGE